VSPWLITSFGLTAGQRLVAALLTLGHHRITVALVTVGAATTIVGMFCSTASKA